MKKIVTVIINEGGNSNIDLAGFQGKGCSKVMELFQGKDKITAFRKKPEMAIEPAKATMKVNQ